MKVTLSSHCKNLKPGWDQPENGKQFLRHGIGQQQQHAIMYTASFRHRFNSARSTIDPLIDGVTPLPLSLPFHFPLEHKPHSLYCSFLTSIYFVLSPFLSASTLQMREALWSTAGMFVWAGQCLSVPGVLVESESGSILKALTYGDKRSSDLIGIAHGNFFIYWY